MRRVDEDEGTFIGKIEQYAGNSMDFWIGDDQFWPERLINVVSRPKLRVIFLAIGANLPQTFYAAQRRLAANYGEN